MQCQTGVFQSNDSAEAFSKAIFPGVENHPPSVRVSNTEKKKDMLSTYIHISVDMACLYVGKSGIKVTETLQILFLKPMPYVQGCTLVCVCVCVCVSFKSHTD